MQIMVMYLHKWYTCNIWYLAISFTQFSGAGQVEAGDGLSRSGTTISVNVDDKTLQISSDNIRIKGISATAVGDLLLEQVLTVVIQHWQNQVQTMLS